MFLYLFMCMEVCVCVCVGTKLQLINCRIKVLIKFSCTSICPDSGKSYSEKWYTLSTSTCVFL